MNDNVSVISECDNLEIENYLKTYHRKNTDVVKFNYSDSVHHQQDHQHQKVDNLIRYSKSMLHNIRDDLKKNNQPYAHIVVEKERLNEILKTKLKAYLLQKPVLEETASCSSWTGKSSKNVYFKENLTKPLVRNGVRIKSDRHFNCYGNNRQPKKPSFVSPRSKMLNDNKGKTSKIGRNIEIDPWSGNSFYPRRIFKDPPQEFATHGITWHDKLVASDINHSSKSRKPKKGVTVKPPPNSRIPSQVIRKSEIKILRYNFDWGDADVVSNGMTSKKVNIDQTTQTENNIVTTKSVACFTDKTSESDTIIENENESPIEPIAVETSSHKTDGNIEVTVGSSFVYESTFDDSSSETELSETVRPIAQLNVQTDESPQASPCHKAKKDNILLETVVFSSDRTEKVDAEIQTTEYVPSSTQCTPTKQTTPIIVLSSDEDSPKDIDMKLFRLHEEIFHTKFKLISALSHSHYFHSSPTQPVMRNQGTNQTTQTDTELQLTPFKPRQVDKFIASPLELSSIRPLSLTWEKNSTAFETNANSKYWQTINKIQMAAARKPFSPKCEPDEVVQRAAERFLKTTVNNTSRIEPLPATPKNSTSSSSLGSQHQNPSILTLTTSESASDFDNESDSTISLPHTKFISFDNLNKLSSGKLSDGEVLSLGEVIKSTDEDEDEST